MYDLLHWVYTSNSIVLFVFSPVLHASLIVSGVFFVLPLSTKNYEYLEYRVEKITSSKKITSEKNYAMYLFHHLFYPHLLDVFDCYDTK